MTGSNQSNTKMRILFTQNRFHSNQHPIIKGLIQRGHKVEYITRIKRPSAENYNFFEPTALGYSSISEYLLKILNKFENDKKRYAWPPIRRFFNKVVEFNPDVIIGRGYTIYTMLFFTLSKIIGADYIVYHQGSKYKNDFGNIVPKLDRLHRILWNEPLIEITPCKGDEIANSTRSNIYYLPFVVDPEAMYDMSNKDYFRHGKINIISVGQYHLKRKNHLLLLKCINNLRQNYDIHLTIIGRLIEETPENYKRIKKYIRENNLSEIVTLKSNLDYDEVQSEYFKNDLYVLPSRNEPAAVSHLEAMSQGLPVICSDENGTRNYIKRGKNGYIFESDNLEDLQRCIEAIISDREKVREMGEKSRRLVESKHLPRHYCERLEEIIQCNFNSEAPCDLPEYDEVYTCN